VTEQNDQATTEGEFFHVGFVLVAKVGVPWMA
jgi:hypothetical protein